ncbi:MAG: TonB-dependent receptor plug domain-containing protein [Bacteroidota bacterium]
MSKNLTTIFPRKIILAVCMIFILLSTNYKGFSQQDSLFDLSFEDLMNIPIVAAGKQEQTIAEIPASTVIILRKEIEEFGYHDLKSILNNIPGYYALSNLGIDIYGVRGYAKGKGSNFIILLNGTKITDENILRFYQIPVENIEKIEVIRGPMAVMYGNNAFFGVINIITEKDSNPSDYNNLAAISNGSWNTFNTSFKVTATQKDLRFNLDFAYNKSDGMDVPLDPMMKRPEKMNDPLFKGSNDDGLNLPEYAQRTKNLLNKESLFFNLNGGFRDFYYNVFFNESKNKHYYYFPSLETGSEFIHRNVTFMAGYNHSFSETFRIDTRLRYSRRYSHFDYKILFEGFYGYDIYNIAEVEGEINFFWRPIKHLDITGGIQYENMFENLNEGDVPAGGAQNMYFQIVNIGDEAVTASAYTQVSYKPIKNLNLVGGIRLEKSYGYGMDFEFDKGLAVPDSLKRHYAGYKPDGEIIALPRAALIYTINKNNIFKLLYGQALKRPDVTTIADDMSDISKGEKDAYSEPEFIETFEFNYFSFISKKFNFNISIYWNNLDNLLVERNEIVDDILRAWWSNSGKINTKGFELNLKAKPINSLLIDFSGTTQSTKNMTFDTDGSFSPELLLNFKLLYNLNQSYIFSIIGNYTSLMKPYFDPKPIFDNDGNSTGEYVGRTADDVPAYFTVDLNFRWQADYLKNFYLNINASNIFDQQILYPTFPRNSAWADKGTLGYGRQFYFTLGYKF